jgi:hypothetical protein
MTTITASDPVQETAPEAPQSEAPATSPPVAPPADLKQFGQQLSQQATPVRLKIGKFGNRKTLEDGQRETAADCFQAESEILAASKKLLDNKSAQYKAVSEALGLARATWQAMTYPFPEKGMRLIRRDCIGKFEESMNAVKATLATAVAELDTVYAEMREQAKQRLGTLYNPADYPDSIVGQFRISWDYPTAAAPALYEQQKARVESQFAYAIAMFEDTMTEELQKLVALICERLTESDDGKKKKFKNSAVANFSEFFDRFQSLSLGSNPELNKLVAKAKLIVSGVDPEDLRKDTTFRAKFHGEMAEVQKALDGMLEARPQRAFFDEAG